MGTQAQHASTEKDQAIAWLVRRHSGRWSEADQRALQEWLSESDSHRHTFQHMERLWAQLDGLRARAAEELEAAKHYSRPKGRYAAFRGAAWVTLGLAAIVVGVVVGLDRWRGAPAETYRTAKGEHQTIPLADGSGIELNTDTVLSVQLSKALRTVRLERGEALFTVVHDASRPFEVITDQAHIRDLGTQFAVYKEGDALTVAVLEGTVSVVTERTTRERRLSAGYRLAYQGGELSTAEPFDASTALAWREGQLLFRGVTLGEMLEQIGRYHEVTFLVADPRLNALKVSGTFATSDLKLMLDALQVTLPVQVTSVNERWVLIAPRAPRPRR